MNNPPYILVDEFQTLVAAVKAKLSLPVLNYQYGYIAELQATLKDYSLTAQYRVLKYPLVWLVQPFTIDRVNGNYFGDTSLRIFIIQESATALKAPDRMTDVFKPVLYPIYGELMQQIGIASQIFDGMLNKVIPHRVIDRYYWGEEQQDKIDDVFDCMEISNLKLKIKNNPNCESEGF